MSKMKQVLPNSPRKRRGVISKLAKSAVGISPRKLTFHRNRNKPLPKSTVKVHAPAVFQHFLSA